MGKEEKLYHAEFGDIPNDLNGRIEYILGKHVNSESMQRKIDVEVKRWKSIKYKTVKFIFYKIVRPSARPRLTRRRGFPSVYVPRAAEDGKWFERFQKEHNLPHIDTPCQIFVKIYERTPKSLSIVDRVMCELGHKRPWKRTGDIDNHLKTILDMIQHGMLGDDCLVFQSVPELYYSIKPRAEIEIRYMTTHPDKKGEK